MDETKHCIVRDAQSNFSVEKARFIAQLAYCNATWANCRHNSIVLLPLEIIFCGRNMTLLEI